MSNSFKQIFYLKKGHSGNSASATIYLRLTVNGKRTEISSQRNCDPKKWNSKQGRLSGKNEESQSINESLAAMEYRIYDIRKNLIADGSEITGEIIKAKFLGIEDKKHSLIESYRYHNSQLKELVGISFAIGTYKKYLTALASLEKFLIWKYKLPDVPLSKLDYVFVTDYEFYLKTVGKMQHNTAMGIIKKLKKIVGLCLKNGWLVKDPFINHKIKLNATHRTFLTIQELTRMINKPLLIQRMEQVRDIFVFSCYTGLSFSDVKKLSAVDIVLGIDNKNWISICRTKTNELSRIPVLPIAAAILEKYKNDPKAINDNTLLPVISNQRMNSYLKELADICGINKELSTHCARHTFATTITLTNGVPIETVSKMLGHSNIRTTQIYAKVLDQKIKADMDRLLVVL